ncbi:hypothetical protein [Sulfoacidibacillus thermotolerans]|uniref:Uncharacterized protein n=1 Tax=Sulfoacidibacillus thermotolerans TaxID=1765684 RepID=A0A2U3D5V2_SULT2|nr:hypothetical protein [Sulfoacidibacillus thermotolerans]PWI56639.1 hypothetical protein BM613_12725 [Sulfoacidibacillus thermotolerans]
MKNNLAIAGDSPSAVVQAMQQVLNAVPGLVYAQAILGVVIVVLLVRGVYKAAVSKNVKLVYLEISFGALALLEVFDPLFIPNVLANILMLFKL